MTPLRIALAALVVGVIAVDIAHQGSRLYRCRAERVGLSAEIDLLRRERDAVRVATQQRLLAPFLERVPAADLVRLEPPRSSTIWSAVEEASPTPRQAFATEGTGALTSPPLREWLRGR